MDKSSPIILIGMHRSGTSLVTQLLARLGMYVGKELDNHYESVCFKRINRALLNVNGANWADPDPFLRNVHDRQFVKEAAELASRLLEAEEVAYGTVKPGAPWGWKDPRNTLTLPIWLDIFPSAKIVAVVRNGVDVGLSLQRRELKRWFRPSHEKRMYPPTFSRGYHLWQQYLQLSLPQDNQHEQEWMVVRYEDLLSDPVRELTRLNNFVPLDASKDAIVHLTSTILRQPTRMAIWEKVQVKVTERLHLIDLEPLTELGYR